MKRLNILFFACLVSLFASQAHAQDITFDEILEGYLENTGGADSWEELKGLKIMATFNQMGQEFPVEIVQLRDGRQYTKITFQGQEMMQGVFDGEVLWNTGFPAMKPEKADQESSDNFKLETNDFPQSFIGYKEKGYTVEVMGTETIDGAETYKVKLVKEPKTLAGETVEDISYYYFDTEAFVPIAQDSDVKEGPMAGKIQRVTMSDYDEVDGLYFPFSMTQGIKDGPSSPIVIDSYELNPSVDESIFKFPDTEE